MSSLPEEHGRPSASGEDSLAAQATEAAHSDADAPGRATGAPDTIRPLVAEIRGRMRELAARELVLQQRERELDQQYRQLLKQAHETAQREWAESQERQRQRSAELDAQSVELVARGAHFEELERRLADREATVEQARGAVAEQVARLRRRIEDFRRERRQQHDLLRRRIAVIRDREKEVERRIQQAHGDIVRQRQELEQKRAALQQVVAGLERREKELQARKAGLEMEVARLQARAGELNRQFTELQTARVELDQRQQEVARGGHELEQGRAELAKKQQALHERWQAARGQRSDLARQVEELDARRRDVEEGEATARQRLGRLEHYEQQLRARATTLEDEARRLAEFKAELAEREKSVEDLVKRGEQAARDAERYNEQAQALREQAEARDASSRQTQLAIELEREALARQRAAMAQVQEELDGQRSRREAEFEQIRALLRQQAERIQRAQRAVVLRPARWWLRSGALAAIIGLLAAWAWLHANPPIHRVTGKLSLVGQGDWPDVVAAHEQRLRSPGIGERLFAETAPKQAWDLAQQRGNLHILSRPDEGTIHLSIEGPDRRQMERLLESAGRAYAEMAAGLPGGPEQAAAAERLRSARAELEDELKQRERRRSAALAQLAPLADEAKRDEVRADVQRLRTEYQEVSRTLREQRARLADLDSGLAPRGSVSPADYENALAADEAIQEDLKEFRAVVLQYRSELAVAMLLVVDPLHQLRAAVGRFADALAEQRALQPPADVAAALERCADQTAAFGERVAAFGTEWNGLLDALQALVPEEEIVKLVQHQRAVDDAARRFAQQATGLVGGLRQQLDQLTEQSDGGTRVVVVAAVMRGELGKLDTAAVGVAGAVENVDLAGNFRLDALDRQLRAVQARLERRQDTLRRLLQFEADERSRQAHAQRSVELRERVQHLEQRRETLIVEADGLLDELRRLDEEVAQRREHEAVARRCEADVVDLSRRIDGIDQQIADLQAGAGAALEWQAAGAELVGERHRWRKAALAAVVAAGFTGMICLLSVMRNPWRRPLPWEQALGEAGLLGGGESEPRPPVRGQLRPRPSRGRQPAVDRAASADR